MLKKDVPIREYASKNEFDLNNLNEIRPGLGDEIQQYIERVESFNQLSRGKPRGISRIVIPDLIRDPVPPCRTYPRQAARNGP